MFQRVRERGWVVTSRALSLSLSRAPVAMATPPGRLLPRGDFLCCRFKDQRRTPRVLPLPPPPVRFSSLSLTLYVCPSLSLSLSLSLSRSVSTRARASLCLSPGLLPLPVAACLWLLTARWICRTTARLSGIYWFLLL